MKKENNFDRELEKWFRKWHRKVVTGRCLIELKQRDKEFIKKLGDLKEELKLDFEADDIYIDDLFKKLVGGDLI